MRPSGEKAGETMPLKEMVGLPGRRGGLTKSRGREKKKKKTGVEGGRKSETTVWQRNDPKAREEPLLKHTLWCKDLGSGSKGKKHYEKTPGKKKTAS